MAILASWSRFAPVTGLGGLWTARWTRHTVLSIQEPEKDPTKQDSGIRNKVFTEISVGNSHLQDLRTHREDQG